MAVDLCLYFGGAKDRTPSLTYARQAFYYWETSPALAVIIFLFFDFNLRAGEMAQWVKVFAVKPGDLRFIPGATW